MATLTVPRRGRLPSARKCCNTLGSSPEKKVEIDLLPNGRAALSAMQPKASVRALHGFLKGKTNGKVLTIEEIDNAIAEQERRRGRASEDHCRHECSIAAVVGDDPKQSRAAIRAMEQAETVAVSQHALCELSGCSTAVTAYRARYCSHDLSTARHEECSVGPARGGSWFGGPRCRRRFADA